MFKIGSKKDQPTRKKLFKNNVQIIWIFLFKPRRSNLLEVMVLNFGFTRLYYYSVFNTYVIIIIIRRHR